MCLCASGFCVNALTKQKSPFPMCWHITSSPMLHNYCIWPTQTPTREQKCRSLRRPVQFIRYPFRSQCQSFASLLTLTIFIDSMVCVCAVVYLYLCFFYGCLVIQHNFHRFLVAFVRLATFSQSNWAERKYCQNAHPILKHYLLTQCEN